jgi:hypothetical protein
MTTRAQSVWNKIALLEVLDADFQSGRKSASNVGIQKLTFLTELVGRSKDIKAAYYRFYRFKHGPLSKELLNDVSYLERFNFIDSESRELLDRGKYLLDYVKPEIDASGLATEVVAIARSVAEEWKYYRGWDIVNKVYELSVPVDGMGRQRVRVSDIPIGTDILVPEWSHERDVQPFSADTIDDIQSELSIPWSDLDPDSEEVWRLASASLSAAFNR